VRVAYVGHEALTFTDYIDLKAGKTLHAVPGETYDIAPASGRVVPQLPEPWFVLAEGGGEDEGTPAEGDGVPPEPGGEQEAGGEPSGDEDPETGSGEG
jgi:hypothetical protein